MDKKAPSTELTVTPEGLATAQQIIKEMLGDGFYLDYTVLPRNTGVMGDEGVRGYSPVISCGAENPAQFVTDNSELVSGVAQRICNETGGACRVLFDITPGGGEFEAIDPSQLAEL